MILSKSKIYELALITPELIDKKLVEIYFGTETLNQGMSYAALADYEKLIYFHIRQGANDWNWGMAGAVEGGHEKLVYYFISRGPDNWEYGMNCAVDGGYEKFVDFFCVSRSS